MALLGQAALAMWWDMAPDMGAEFQRWPSQEHFRERLAIFAAACTHCPSLPRRPKSLHDFGNRFRAAHAHYQIDS